jgi:plasmid stability protein
MSELSKRATVYFDPALHRALRVRAATSNQSVSELVDEAIRQMMKEDQEDLETYAARVAEPEISYEAMLGDLKKHGKI